MSGCRLEWGSEWAGGRSQGRPACMLWSRVGEGMCWWFASVCGLNVWMCGWYSSEGPAERPYIPFEGRSTAQDAYQPKLLDEGPTFGGRPGLGQEAQAVRPYIPFEGESVTKSSYP